jgi:hypothetical protein
VGATTTIEIGMITIKNVRRMRIINPLNLDDNE